MKNIILILFIIALFAIEILSQVVIGKLVDENADPLAEVQLQLYAPPYVYDAISGVDGTFSFNIITGVKDSQLPTGYYVSDNFPNPFNPKTRIGITLPNREDVRVEVFNLIGQAVTDVIEQTFNMGTNFIDLELSGLPNGFYISRITIGDKYTIIKKMMLIYGSQHLAITGGVIGPHLSKSDNGYLDTILDSLVASSAIIGSNTFTNLPPFVSGTLDLGNLTIIRYCSGTPTVQYGGKTYNTVKIGNQCWLKENLDIGTMVQGTQAQTNNGLIEKYCYDDDPANCTTYGGLYLWNETMQYSATPGVQGICPDGWHIPIFSEFETLMATVGNNSKPLKAIGQGTHGGVGTNTSGFSTLLAGLRLNGGSFVNLGTHAWFWSSTEYDLANAFYLIIMGNTSYVNLTFYTKEYGFCIRCIRD